MKRYLLLIAITIFLNLTIFAQDKQSKPSIDVEAIKNWPSLGPAIISSNGQYLFYTIVNKPVGERTAVIQSSNKKWKKEFICNASWASFTPDSKFAIFKPNKDSLLIQTLGTSNAEYIPNVSMFVLNNNISNQYLAYKKQSPENKLILRNLDNKKISILADLSFFSFSNNGKSFIYEQKGNTDKDRNLFWMDLISGNTTKIWNGSGATNFVFSDSGEQMAFSSMGKEKKAVFWYYKKGMAQAINLVDNQSKNIPNGFELDDIDKFTNLGDKLLIHIKSITNVISHKTSTSTVKLNIWSYTDQLLQSEQSRETSAKKYLAAIILNQELIPRILRLEEQNERCIEIFGDYALLVKKSGESSIDQINWNISSQQSFSLKSLIDGTKKAVPYNRSTIFAPKLSPNGRYLLYFDPDTRSYYSFESHSGITRNLTKDLKGINWTQSYDLSDSFASPYRIIGWVNDNSSVLLNDQNDIWQISLNDTNLPLNLTNGFGKKHNTFFEWINDRPNNFKANDFLICTAFDKGNKLNGFYQLTIGKQQNPKLLTMDKCFYYADQAVTGVEIIGGVRFIPLKASNAKKYIVRRGTASTFYNYFCTSDFKRFTQLTDLAPEKRYNWMTAELHNWKSLDGKTLKGVLYKPEDFDPNKKYPLIFNVYEQLSDNLYISLKPGELTNGSLINIPSYVSKGYLIFIPDIEYSIGDPMQGTYDAIISAINYLVKLEFINSQKIGIQGGSHGGLETNYLVTQTDLFAAVCTASGASDIISKYGSIKEDGSGDQGYIETGQGRMGHSLWENPNLYIKNSPIFYVDKVTTPLLIMHTSIDGAVPFSQALELFTAFRRLGKKVWLLEYNEGNHGVSGASATDFGIRMQQFFDYYLKDQAAPKWMLDGIPARLKGIEMGLELDSSGRHPGPGLITEQEKKRIDIYSTIPLKEK